MGTTQDGNVGAGRSTTMESMDMDLNQDDCRDTFRKKQLTLESQSQDDKGHEQEFAGQAQDEQYYIRMCSYLGRKERKRSWFGHRDNFRDEECCMEDVQLFDGEKERDLLKDE